MSIKCAECQCVPEECIKLSNSQRCQNCTKETCCCLIIYHTAARNLSVMDDIAALMELARTIVVTSRAKDKS